MIICRVDGKRGRSAIRRSGLAQHDDLSRCSNRFPCAPGSAARKLDGGSHSPAGCAAQRSARRNCTGQGRGHAPARLAVDVRRRVRDAAGRQPYTGRPCTRASLGQCPRPDHRRDAIERQFLRTDGLDGRGWTAVAWGAATGVGRSDYNRPSLLDRLRTGSRCQQPGKPGEVRAVSGCRG